MSLNILKKNIVIKVMNKGIIFFIILLVLPFNSNSNENFNLKFHRLNIHSMSGENLNKIGTIRGNVEEYPYGINYYANVKDGKYLIPITWMKGKFKSKSKAINWIETQVKLFSLRDN